MTKSIGKYKYLLLRRFSQVTILLLFVLANCSFVSIGQTPHLVFQSDISGFVVGERNLAITNPKEKMLPLNILEGDLSFSKIAQTIPMSDPLAFMQIFLAGGAISLDLLLGLAIVLGIYVLFMGRGFCAFVCPINMVVDLANYLRRVFHIENTRFLGFSRNTRFVILGLALVLSFIFGVLAWEMISPISMLHRGLVFGLGVGFFGILAVFLFDLFMLKNGFCGYICPLGATYSLIGAKSLLRIKHNVENCTHCSACTKICPEVQVLDMIGKRSAQVTNIACIKCGRCIEVCNDNALTFSILNCKKESVK